MRSNRATFWKVRPMPSLGMTWRGWSQDRAALEQDVALVGHVEAGQAIEERGLAGAVGADQPGDAAGRHVEGDAVERDDAAEAHRHVAHAQQRAGGAGLGRGAHLRLRNHGRTPAPNILLSAARCSAW